MTPATEKLINFLRTCVEEGNLQFGQHDYMPILTGMIEEVEGEGTPGDDDTPIIRIELYEDFEPNVILGELLPPAHILADTRSQDVEFFWQSLISNLWGQWQEAEPEHECSSDFVDWLVDQNGWERYEQNIITVEV